MKCTFPAVKIWIASVLLTLIFIPRALADVNVWEALFETTTLVKDLICDPDIPNRMYGITEVNFENGPTYYLPSISENEGHTWQGSYTGLGIDPEPTRWLDCRLVASYSSNKFELYWTVFDSASHSSKIYQSQNRGITWALYSELDVSIKAIEIFQSTSEVWMLMGDNSDSHLMILRSEDRGKNWTSVFNYEKKGSRCALRQSLSSPNILIAGVDIREKHVARSDDLGRTWTLLPVGDLGWNSPEDAEIHPNNSDEIVLTIEWPGSWPAFLLRSIDGGQTWFFFGPPETNPYGGSRAIHYDSRDPNIVYVMKMSGDVLWRSSNGGIDWEIVLQDVRTEENQRPRFVESPWDTDTVYLNIGGVYVSRDRGHTWTPTGQIDCTTFYVHPADSNYMYSASNHYSFFRSTDRGHTWHSAAKGIPFLETVADDDTICASGVDPQNLWLACARTQDCGEGELNTIFKSTDYGASWQMMSDPPGYGIWRLSASQQVSNRVFAIVFDVIDNHRVNYRLAMSDDGGLTWRESIIPGIKHLARFLEYPDPLVWFLIGELETDSKVRLFVSNDEGITWICKGSESGLDANYSVNAEIILDPYHELRLYISTSSGDFLSDDRGDSWKEWDGGHPTSSGGIRFDPFDVNVMYCGGYRTVDSSITWTDNKEFSLIRFDSDYPSILYQHDIWDRPMIARKMTISTEKPSLFLAGYGNTLLNVGLPGVLQIYAYAKDSDPNDQVTSIELFYNGEPIGDRLSDESAPSSGLFYKLYNITPSASGKFNLQLRAKDRFGLLSDPWPAMTVK